MATKNNSNGSGSSSSSSGGEMLSLCLTSRQGRQIVTIPSTSTTKDLHDAASAKFGGAEICSLKYGFPPRPLGSDPSTFLSSLVQNQERIQVEFGSSSSSTTTTANNKTTTTTKNSAAKKKSTKKACTSAAASSLSPATTATTSSNSSRRTSQRAAAKAATESFSDVIKAQNAIMAASPSTSRNNKRRAATSPPATNAATNGKNTKSKPQFASDVGDGRRLVDGASTSPPPFSSHKTQKRVAATTTPSPRATKFAKAAGDGRRLADGTTVHRTNSKSKQPSQQQQPTDHAEALLGALDNKGKMGQVLRKGMRNAVAASYETTRAFSRLAAIQAQSYNMQALGGNDGGSGGGGGGSLLQVSFMGSVDKTKVQETVDLIPRTVLEAVLRGIHASNPEALRPENLSRLSPRVLWSLVHEYPNQTSIKECYISLLPELEWKFLQRRAPQLSEKALENLRQEQEAKAGTGGGDMNLDQAAEAIQAVEHAMEHLHDYESTERKARLARAAVARQQQQQQQHDLGDTIVEWKLVTPSEPDRDELLQCIRRAPSAKVSLTEQEQENVENALVDLLMSVCHIHNWRELANVQDSNSLASQLQQSVLETKRPTSVTPQWVQQWIDHAQDESVNEIIVEVCDGVTDYVECLTEHARTGTPKDLAAWRCIPEALHEQIRSSSSSSDITIVQLSTWCDRAHALLQEYEWLNWYATPIE